MIISRGMINYADALRVEHKSHCIRGYAFSNTHSTDDCDYYNAYRSHKVELTTVKSGALRENR